jgi:hypothetical protein
MKSIRFLRTSATAAALVCSVTPMIAACQPAHPVPPASTAVAERQIYADAARVAWDYVQRNSQSSTGLVKALDSYEYVTIWDIGSTLAAVYSAHELKLIPDAAYDTRVRRILATLGSMELFDKGAYNKAYSSSGAKMINREIEITKVGYGWSAIDLGRLLIWLRVIAVNQPQYAILAEGVVRRLDMTRIVRDGYLHGEDISLKTKKITLYQEGGIGYEQYAAIGFALWGARAEKALDPNANSIPVSVLGVTIYGDKRGSELLTSEPYVLTGMEVGWYAPEFRQQAWRILAAQQARYETTGVVTCASEDALPDPPYYFYYYDIYHSGKSFVIDPPGSATLLDAPRWVSAKCAFGWHSLLPSTYTLLMLQTVRPAGQMGRGWGAGIYEKTGKPTGAASLNTAASILESAAFYLKGRPLLEASIY